MSVEAVTYPSYYTLKQEKANLLTALLGTILVLLGTAVLVVLACTRGNVWHIVSFSLYGATLFLLYLTATIYHGLRPSGAKRVFEILDHSAIFLLIAGTYSPFTLVVLRGPWGWSLFGVVWGLGILGIVYKLFFIGRHGLFSTSIYIGLGWIAVLALKPLMTALAPGGMVLLVLGD